MKIFTPLYWLIHLLLMSKIATVSRLQLILLSYKTFSKHHYNLTS